jgi:hypothetical protein
MQFFFGYVENYALMTALVCLFLTLGWLSLKRRLPVWWALAALLAAGAFHLSALFLLPGLIYLLWARGRSDKHRNRYNIAAILISAAALIGGALFYAMFKGDEVFCPIAATEFNPYSLLSVQHLTDTANLLLLIAPLPLMLIAAMIRGYRTRHSLTSHDTVFFAVCAAGGLFLLFFVDPKLGAIRDWDLLSLYGVPLAFLSLNLVLGNGGKSGMTPVVVLQAGLAVLLAHTIPWVASNTSPNLTLNDMKQVVLEDIHYTPEYYEGDRLMTWGLMLSKLFGDVEEQQRCFRLRASAKPDDQRAWIFYATASSELGQYDKVEEALEHVQDPGRLKQGQLERLTSLQLRVGQTEQAKQSLALHAEKFPESFDYLFNSGLIHQWAYEDEIAAAFYGRALAIKPKDINLLLNYASVSMNIRDLSRADELLNTASGLPDLTEKDIVDIKNLRQLLSDIADEMKEVPESP